MRGQAPYEIKFRWVYGPPLPVGLDPKARQALIQERIAKIFEQVAWNTDPPAEDREDMSPGRDSERPWEDTSPSRDRGRPGADT
jgi:hypothetical protein